MCCGEFQYNNIIQYISTGLNLPQALAQRAILLAHEGISVTSRLIARFVRIVSGCVVLEITWRITFGSHPLQFAAAAGFGASSSPPVR
jgi:hypothetical protein